MPFIKRQGRVTGYEVNNLGHYLELAENQIYQTFGDRVSVVDKAKTLRKFGRNTAVGSTFETIWQRGGNETYVTSNLIDTISSSDAGDTQSVVIEGHTISNGLLTFSTQTATLNGQNKVTLTTPLARMTRLYNNGTTDFAGIIYGYEDSTISAGVPSDASKVHIQVSQGNQSEKASTSISNSDYYILTSVETFVFTKTSESAEFIGEMRQVASTPKAWRRVYSTVASNQGAVIEYFDPPFIVPRNYDIRVRAKSDGTSIDVGAAFNGYLAKVIE